MGSIYNTQGTQLMPLRRLYDNGLYHEIAFTPSETDQK